MLACAQALMEFFEQRRVGNDVLARNGFTFGAPRGDDNRGSEDFCP